MSRRFLFLLLAVAGLLSLSRLTVAADTTGAEKNRWKLTLQSWTNNKQSVTESIELAQKLSVRFIEIYPGQAISPTDKGKFGPEMTETQMETVLKKCKDSNVQLIDCGVIDIPNTEEAAKKFFGWAKKLGITIIVSEPDRKALPMIDKVAGEFGIKVAIHDHPKPSQYWNPDDVYEVTKDLKNVGFCADVGHWKRSGLEPVDVLKKYGEKVYSLHFKDLVPNEDGKGGWHDVIWGTGQSKAAEMLLALKQKGFQGPIAIEFEHKWEQSTLQDCADFFHKTANTLAGK